MSLLFNRTAELIITGAGEQRVIRDLRISFSVKKTRSDTPNSADIMVYNPNPSTRLASLDNSATVELRAGYGGDNVLLTRSDIDRAIVVRSPPDVILDIAAQDGLRKLRETTISISHASGSSIQTVLDEIIALLDIPVRPITADLTAALRGGFAHVGKPSRALSDLMRRIDGAWSIQNGELVILGETGAVEGETIPLITPQSGLIGSPLAVEEQTSSIDKNTEPKRGFYLTTLLNPAIEPGSLIQIQSQDVDGVYVVDEIDHRGDTRGQEWYSNITCYEVGA